VVLCLWWCLVWIWMSVKNCLENLLKSAALQTSHGLSAKSRAACERRCLAMYDWEFSFSRWSAVRTIRVWVYTVYVITESVFTAFTSYDTQPGNEVGLFYNAPKPTQGMQYGKSAASRYYMDTENPVELYITVISFDLTSWVKVSSIFSVSTAQM